MKTLDDKQLKYLRTIIYLLNTHYDNNEFVEDVYNGTASAHVIKVILERYCEEREYNDINSKWLNDLKKIYYRYL